MDINMNRSPKSAQTFVFLLVALTAIFLICGMGIDTGLLFLAKARLSRALDASVLAAIGNFNIPGNTGPQNNRGLVSLMMRNVAAANYSNLEQTYNQVPAEIDDGQITQSNGQKAEVYEYDFWASTSNSGPTGLYYKVYLQSGANGQIIEAGAYGDVPTKTFFMGMAGNQFNVEAVQATSSAERSPRLIMIVADRSSSMLANQGATSLPYAIVNFMSYFDPNNDAIGLASFGSAGRLEFPLTTNFVYAATNSLEGCLDTTDDLESGDDADQDGTAAYFTSGVRRLKFGGVTAADEGLRIAMEQLMSNSGFANPNVKKIMVIFTDGAWNTTRTLVAAPGYTNIVSIPASASASNLTNTTYYMPTLTPYSTYTNSIAPAHDLVTGSPWNSIAQSHTNDFLQSVDTVQEGFTSLGLTPGATWGSSMEGKPGFDTNVSYITTNSTGGSLYSTNLNVWIPIGAVDYNYSNSTIAVPDISVSRLSSMTNGGNGMINCNIFPGGSNILVVPGYIMDGTVCNNLATSTGDSSPLENNSYGYNLDNFQDKGGRFPDNGSFNFENYTYIPSVMRGLMFRNFMNLMTGFVVYDAYDPPQTGVIGQDTNIWLDDQHSHFIKPLHGYGEYYPGAAQFSSFNDMGYGPNDLYYGPYMPGANYTTMNPPGGLLLGEGWEVNPESSNGNAYYYRFCGYTVAPQINVTNNWNGQIFYFGTSSTSFSSGSTSVSALDPTGANWKKLSNTGAEQWIINDFQSDMVMTGNQYTASSNSALMNASVWRPATYRGNPYIGLPTQADISNFTGGYMYDDTKAVPILYNNSMAYSGRPTHYYDFSQSEWVPITNNHAINASQDVPSGSGGAFAEVNSGTAQFTHLCFWKAMEYAYQARMLGVTVYSIGYSAAVTDDECDVLGQMANSYSYVNASGTTITNLAYDPTEPVGQMYFATDASQITSDFEQIGQAVTGFLSQ